MHSPLHILLADEDHAVRHAVSRALRCQYPDADVQEARTCAEAEALCLAQAFDCLFLDTNLPDTTALHCVQTVRAAGNLTPIILLTAQDNEAIAQQALQAGATDYVPKSDLSPTLLAHCLRNALRYGQSQTQVRRAYEALELRDRAIAAASNGIIIADPNQPDCPIIYCNPAFTTMTGYAPEEALGRNCRFLQGAETDQEYIQQVRDCLAQKQECQVVLKNFRKDGTLFWNELTISPVRDTAGRVTHFIGVQTDITKRRAAEDALHRSIACQQALLRDMFASVTGGKLTLCGTPDDLPPTLERFTDPVPLSPTSGVRELRHHTLNACLAARIPEARRYDLETAVGEAAMNAVVHAHTGTGHVFTHERGTVQVHVTDTGKGIAMENLPNATLRRGYSSAGTFGHGFKMILKTVDRVFLLTGASGTTVVIEQDREPSPATWQH